MQVALVLGDWSNDGHGRTETFYIESNLSPKEIEKAYAKGSLKLGIDLVESICEEYEDDRLWKDDLEKFRSAGFKDVLDKSDEDDEFTDSIHLGYEDYTKLYLFTVSLGNPLFKFSFLKSKENPVVRIGGYGLF